MGEGGNVESLAPLDDSEVEPPARDTGLDDDATGDELDEGTGARYPAERSKDRSMVPSQGPLEPELLVNPAGNTGSLMAFDECTTGGAPLVDPSPSETKKTRGSMTREKKSCGESTPATASKNSVENDKSLDAKSGLHNG